MSIIKANYANLQNAVGELQICAKELEKYGADIKHIQKQIAKATEYDFSGNLLADILGVLGYIVRAAKFENTTAFSKLDDRVLEGANDLKKLSSALNNILSCYAETENKNLEHQVKSVITTIIPPVGIIGTGGKGTGSGKGTGGTGTGTGTGGTPTPPNLTQMADPTKASKEVKDNFIKEYELSHPEIGKNMDECLKGIKSKENGEEHIRNIKVLAYTAEEPYRSLFLESVDKVKINTYDLPDEEGSQYYCSGEVYFRLKDWLYYSDGTPRPITSDTYTTFFHEFGHAIDDLEAPGYKFLTDTFVDENGNTLHAVLENNVRETIRDSADDYLTEMGYTDNEIITIKAEVESAIMNCVDYSNSKYKPIFSSQDVKDCYYAVVSDVKKQISGSSSDVFGGYTGNTLMTNCRHSAINGRSVYWLKGDFDNTGTFIPDKTADGSNVYTNKQPHEYFAEYMAAQMTRNNRELKGLDAYNDATDVFTNKLFTRASEN